MVFGGPPLGSPGWARKSMVAPAGMAKSKLPPHPLVQPCLVRRTQDVSTMLHERRISTPPTGSLDGTVACTHQELPLTSTNEALNGESAKLQYCVVASAFGAGIQL